MTVETLIMILTIIVVIFTTYYVVTLYYRFVDWKNHKRRLKALKKSKVRMIIEI